MAIRPVLTEDFGLEHPIVLASRGGAPTGGTAGGWRQPSPPARGTEATP